MLESTQKLLDELTSSALINGQAEKLRNAPTPKDKVRVCLDDEDIKRTIVEHVKRVTGDGLGCRKDEHRAFELRSRGNNLYSRRGFEAAVKLYSAALRYSPYGSEQMRLGFGNRSAALFEMKQFERCIEDIDRAFKTTSEPANNIKMLRLMVRKGKSYVALDRIEEASEAYSDAIQLATECPQDMENPEEFVQFKKLELEARIALVDMVNILNKESEHKSESSNGTSKKEKREELKPELSYGENPDFPNASNALQLRQDSSKLGRYVVASRHIKRGDTLFYEKPFAFVLLPESYVAHCYHCCKATFNPIPCRKCSEAEYCSDKCREESEAGYHRWECGGGLALCQSVGIAHLGLRLALVGADPDVTDHYTRVRALLSHIDKLTLPDLYQYTLTAAILVTYLEEYTDFFQCCKKDTSEIGGDILEHIGQLVCNGHAITELQERWDEDPSGLYTEEVVRIATAIFTSASMMNHSCDSNIMNSFYNQYLVVRAARDIRPGEQVFNCYGPHYRRMNRSERRKALLEQYKFDCECNFCCGLIAPDFDQLFSCSYVCPTCQGALLPTGDPPTYECFHCSKLRSQHYITEIESRILKSDQFFRTAEEQMEEGNVRNAVENYSKALKFRERALYRYNCGIRDCLDRMAKCYSLIGEYEKSFECLERNLISIEEHFGDCSSEMAFELFKISDVCFKLVQSSSDPWPVVRKVFRYVETARTIIDILFGKWSTKYAEIENIRDSLLALPAKLLVPEKQPQQLEQPAADDSDTTSDDD